MPVGSAKVRMHSIQLGSGWLVAAQPAKAPFPPPRLRPIAWGLHTIFPDIFTALGHAVFLEGTTQFFEKKNLTRVDGWKT